MLNDRELEKLRLASELAVRRVVREFDRVLTTRGNERAGALADMDRELRNAAAMFMNATEMVTGDIRQE